MTRTTATLALVALLTAATASANDHLCRDPKGKVESRDVCRSTETLADVLEADDQMVTACTFVGTVTASSGWGGMAQGFGQSRARASAMKRAAQKGATHIVWSNQSSGYGGANAGARAYKCTAVPVGQGN
jgi:hypothetical protein